MSAQHTPGLRRGIERWRASCPKAMAEQSPAAIYFALDDARHDVLLLAEVIDELRAARSALADFSGLTEPHAHALARRFAEFIAKATGSAA